MITSFRRVADDNDEPVERGTYRRVREYWQEYCDRKGIPNTFWAELVCPGCGKGAMVGSNHTVFDSGVVSPSDVCPHEGCTYHEFITLLDWNRPSTPRRETSPAVTTCDPDVTCPTCQVALVPEHAHHRCPRCGYRSSCCF